MGDQFDCTPKVTVIPCCADMDLFKYDKENSEELKQLRQQEGLDGSFVLTYLGSLGAVYLLPNMVKTFKILKYLDSSSKFLFISNNGKDEVVKEEIFTNLLTLSKSLFSMVIFVIEEDVTILFWFVVAVITEELIKVSKTLFSTSNISIIISALSGNPFLIVM